MPGSSSTSPSIPGLAYEILSHTADTGIEARSSTFNELVSDLATGMFALMAEAEGEIDPEEVEIEVSAPAPDDLVVELLSELLYESDVEDLLFSEFEVDTDDHRSARIRARGIPLSEVELTGPPIKAVTYHDVTVTQTDDGWYARVYFDV